ncbi:MAG: hypothetical protein AAFX39_09295 [Pseudomonadota bacterium]
MTGSQAASADRLGGDPIDRAELDVALKALHGTGAAGELSRLHETAAEMMADSASRRFHLTHAWVFALEAGDVERSNSLEAKLCALGGLSNGQSRQQTPCDDMDV